MCFSGNKKVPERFTDLYPEEKNEARKIFSGQELSPHFNFSFS